MVRPVGWGGRAAAESAACHVLEAEARTAARQPSACSMPHMLPLVKHAPVNPCPCPPPQVPAWPPAGVAGGGARRGAAIRPAAAGAH